LLALLLLQRGKPIDVERLAAQLWADRPPTTAVKTVQVYVAQLRKALGLDVVGTRGRTYLVDLERHQLDVLEFEQLAADGRQLLAEGDAAGAAEALRAALALWRGSALADFAYDDFAQAETARLEESRLAALEARIEADLRLSHHAELVGELEALVREHDEREALCGQLMVALYRSGRQGAALEAYQRLRRKLVDTLGIEPGRTLRELEKDILNQDSSLDAPGTPVPSRDSVVSARGAFVGREQELQELLDGLDRAVAGGGSLFVLVGEPGIGKSRLADEVSARARARGMAVAVGRCWEAGSAPAFWPWIQALRRYLDDLAPDDVPTYVGSGGVDLAQLLPELRTQIRDLPEPWAIESEGERVRLFEAVATFLRDASAARPVLFVLDDLHAADESSLLLLRYLARGIGAAHILLVGALRDVDPVPREPVSEMLADLTREPSVRRLGLARLSEEDVSEYVRLTASEIASPEVVAPLFEETEGNPLFVAETVRLLALESPRRDETGVRIAIPESLKEVIGRRINHLSPGCGRLLVLASVLGREFDLEVLARMAGASEDDVLDVLDEALSARVASDVPGEPDRLRFAHVLIRDTLYDGLSAARRASLHRRAVEALEALSEDDPGRRLAELADHAIAARELEKGALYAERAGDRAAALLAYEEAARLYRLALETRDSESGRDDVRRCDLLLRLGDACARSGDTPAARAAFWDAAEVARGAGLAEHLARAALGYGGRFVWARAWDDRRLAPLLEEALEALPRADSGLRVRLMSRLAGGPLRDTAPTETRVAIAQTALEMAQRLGDPAILAYALSGRHCASWGADALADRIAIAGELIEVAERAGDPERAYEGHDYLYGARTEEGDLLSARDELAAKTRLADALHQPAQLWDVAVNRAQLALFEGSFVEAEALIARAFELGRLAQHANAQQAFELQTYALDRALGRLSRSFDVVERAVETYPAYPIWRFVRADAYAELDRRPDARRAFDALADQEFAVPLDIQWLFCVNLMADVCRYLGDAGRAVTLYGLLAGYAERNVVTPPELLWGSASRALGVLATTTTDFETAERHFVEAIESNVRMGARPWVARAREDYARMLLARAAPGDRERAVEALGEAIADFRELGMASHARRAATHGSG
jgi:DNA-binding SARP family transcriptional activator